MTDLCISLLRLLIVLGIKETRISYNICILLTKVALEDKNLGLLQN